MKYVLVILACLGLLSSPLLAEEHLVMAGVDDPISAISDRVIVQAYSQIGIEVEILKLPAERALSWSNKGKLDGEVNRIKGIERDYQNLIMVPTPINYIEGMAFSTKSDIVVNGWESLKPYSIAIRIGIKYAEIGTKGMNVRKFTSFEKIFELVARGRYDIVIASRFTGLYYINTLNIKNIKAIEPPLLKVNLYHYLHKKHKSLVPRIQSALASMKDKGQIEKIREMRIQELKLEL